MHRKLRSDLNSSDERLATISDQLRRVINGQDTPYPVWDDLIPIIVESGFYQSGENELTCHYCDLQVHPDEVTCADDMYSEEAIDKFHIQKCRGKRS